MTSERLTSFLLSHRPETSPDGIRVLRRLRNFVLGPLFGRISRDFDREVGIDLGWQRQPIHLRWDLCLEEEPPLWVPELGVVGTVASVRHLDAAFGTVQIGGVQITSKAEIEEHFPDMDDRVLESRGGLFLCTTDDFYLTVQAVEDYVPQELRPDVNWDEGGLLDRNASWCEVDANTWKDAVLDLITRHR